MRSERWEESGGEMRGRGRGGEGRRGGEVVRRGEEKQGFEEGRGEVSGKGGRRW